MFIYLSEGGPGGGPITHMSCLSIYKRGYGRGFSLCDISTYKQVKFLGRILQHCCGNSFSFLKVHEYGSEKRKDHRSGSQTEVRVIILLLPLCSMAAAPPVCYALCK